MGIKNVLTKAAGKTANVIAKGAALSPQELEKVQTQREDYLTQMPDPTDTTAQTITERLLAASGVEIFNAYLGQISSLYSPVEKNAEYCFQDENAEWVLDQFDPDYNIRYINITKWVTDKNENSLEKLVNVYEVLSNENCNIALVFQRTCVKTNVYLAVTNTDNANNKVDVDNFKRRIEEAIKGNFPGSEWKKESGIGILPCLKNDISYSVAATSNIPAEKSEKFVSQTIEKLLDGIVPYEDEQEYILILLATPVKDIEDRKMHLAELYSGLTPYASWQTQFSLSENMTTGASATVGVNLGVSAGTQTGQNQSFTSSDGETLSEGEAVGQSETTGETHTDTKGSSDTVGGGVFAGGGVGIPGVANAHAGVSANYSHGWNRSVSEAASKTVGKTVTKNLGKAISKTASVTEGVFKSMNLGGNFGMNFARSSNVSAMIGKSENITQTFENYNIKHTLEYLEKQMKRLDQCTALGMWDFAAYVLCEDMNVANNVAHSYLAITQGEDSYLSQSAINLWRGDMGENSKDANEICSYLRELRHPLFGLNPAIVEADKDFYVYPMIVTATTSLSGKELAYSLNFPKKSVTGLPVIECAEFGRNISTYDATDLNSDKIRLGNIYHMHHEEETGVTLLNQSLASHTFITGSTGSGKSNTVYQILNEIRDTGVKFLVIEPAKGEYKHAYGNDEDVYVFGTNPDFSPLLKINPFSFSHGIHVLEHIDRLVEIFNVCWPMYAAMPAVLKNAIEKSYENCGWDLASSENRFGSNLYPSFKDVCRNVKAIIDSSEYDNENKGAYKGALLTRLQSLTTGLNSLIFTRDEIESSVLFDENVIIDLSRVGSTETKSLLMGMVVLKLQEYRISCFDGANAALKHITVLEEAHNLLKRTSTEQSSENANLLGKSVEMISNAIAEMRTYGEGFIIADQAPGLLDMAAIRNTNTKIIMRLPDQGDRELVGKAAGLNEDQIIEIAKLPRGVAAIYQNEWIQPVLCKVKKANVNEGLYNNPSNQMVYTNFDEKRFDIASLLSNGTELVGTSELNEIKSYILDLPVESSVKVAILKWVENPPKEPRMTKLAPIMSALFPEVKNAVDEAYQEARKPNEWTEKAEFVLTSLMEENIDNQVRRDIIQSIFTDYLMFDMNNVKALELWSKEGGLK